MPKPRGKTGEKNLIADKLKELREKNSMSQRGLADEFQLIGIDIDKNVITRIENNRRYVTDIELCAIVKIFSISLDELLFGMKEPTGEDEELESRQDHPNEDDPAF